MKCGFLVFAKYRNLNFIKNVIFFVLLFSSLEGFSAFKPSFAPTFSYGATKKITFPYLLGSKLEISIIFRFKELRFLLPQKNKAGHMKYYLRFGDKNNFVNFKVKKEFFNFLKYFLANRGKNFPLKMYLKHEDLLRSEFVTLHKQIVKVTRKKVLSDVESLVSSRYESEPVFLSFLPHVIL